MRPEFPALERGQAKLEYALLLVLVALLVMGALVLLAPQISGIYRRAAANLPAETEDTVPPHTGIMQDFLARINRFYQENGRWPRSWKPYNYTDLGLDPDDWDEPVEGIYWGPHGADVGLANRKGDNLEIYVDDLNGNRLHLYNGWNIWCRAVDGKCFYHTVAPENEVDISTLVVEK